MNGAELNKALDQLYALVKGSGLKFGILLIAIAGIIAMLGRKKEARDRAWACVEGLCLITIGPAMLTLAAKIAGIINDAVVRSIGG